MKVSDLRPLSIGEILDVAIKIYWNNALTLIKLVLVIVAPVQVISTLVYASAFPDRFVRAGQTGLPPPGAEVSIMRPEEVAGFVAGIAGVALLSFVSSVLTNAACFKAVADAYLGTKPAWRSSLGFALRRLRSLLWIALLFLVVVIAITFAGFFALAFLSAALHDVPGLIPPLFIIGGVLVIAAAVWISISWLFSIPAALSEEARGTRALGRSYRLVRHRWWPTFAVILVAVLMTWIVQAIVSALLNVVVLTDAARSLFVSLIIGGIVGLIASVLTTPFFAAVVTVVYFDLRVRKEGFDLEVLAQTVGVAPQGGARPLVAPPSPPAGSPPPSWPPPPGWRPPESPPS